MMGEDMKAEYTADDISVEELANNWRGLTVNQERERIRLMLTPMRDWPEALKESLIGQPFCMDVLTDGVAEYVRKMVQ